MLSEDYEDVAGLLAFMRGTLMVVAAVATVVAGCCVVADAFPFCFIVFAPLLSRQ